VVIINADKIRVTGDKLKQKMYYRHSRYPGGLKSVSLEDVLKTNPAKAIQHAVKGMLPHNRLEARMMTRLKVYTGENHPHKGQVGEQSHEPVRVAKDD
jgi:large subunit ribosomal protein L13